MKRRGDKIKGRLGRYERRKELRDTGNKENITVKERKGKWNYRKEGRGEKEIR